MARKYTQEKIAALLAEYETKLSNLHPILNPTKTMSFKEFGSLNAARSKKTRYENNIIVLKIALNKDYPDQLIDELLQ